MDVVTTDRPPGQEASKVAEAYPSLLLGDHSLCPGCGEPVALRILLETLQEMDLVQKTIAVVGHGCYGNFVQIIDLDCTLCLHGRAPASATGMKRMRPGSVVFTMQGDGDMVNEGLAEIVHAAARGENITCILLNNGVFGDTGGQQTATTVIGQRTKTSLEGRDPALHGHPIQIADIIAGLDGVGYVARGAVGTVRGVARTKKMIREAFESQLAGEGLSLVEILTMCPTGWFVTAPEGPDYLGESMESVYPMGELRARPNGEAG